jgi:hypothetical protein
MTWLKKLAVYKTALLLALLVALSLPAIRDLLLPGYFSMHDDFQIMRQIGMDQCFTDGQIPCRWIPDAGFGYGYPMFNYYPPLPYYLGQIFYASGIDVFWTIKILFALSIVLSGIFMFLLVGGIWGALAGLVAAAFYIWAPYHAVDVYVRGALNEAWGLTLFPLILYFAYRLVRGDRKRWLLPGFALSLASLFLSHNVMTLIFGPLLAAWVLLWAWYFGQWRRFREIVIGGIWAVAFSAFFFVPVTVEKGLVHVESLTIGYFNYLAHYADLNQLFVSRFWGYGGSVWGPEDDMALPIGHFHWILGLIGVALSVIMIARGVVKHKLKLRLWSEKIYWFWFFLITGLVYAFLTHSYSVWVWDNFPLLYYAQFPWRLLAIPALSFSITAGIVVAWIGNQKLRAILASALILGVVAWNYPFFAIERQLFVTREEKLSGLLWELQTTGGIFDYLPKSASRPPGAPAFIYPQFLEGNGGIRDYQKGSNWLRFTAVVSSERARLQLPIFEFPAIVATVDGQPLDYGHDEDLGRLEIELPEGEHLVEVRIGNTPVRTLANWTTLAALGGLFIYWRRRD